MTQAALATPAPAPVPAQNLAQAPVEAGRAKAENAARVALANMDPAAATEVMKLL